MRDVGALHMDARHADASSSFPCFLISLRAASHFPFALECRDGGGGKKPVLGFDTASSNNRNADGAAGTPASLTQPSAASLGSCTNTELNPEPTDGRLIRMPARSHILAVVDRRRPPRGSVGVGGLASCPAHFDSWCSVRYLMTRFKPDGSSVD